MAWSESMFYTSYQSEGRVFQIMSIHSAFQSRVTALSLDETDSQKTSLFAQQELWYRVAAFYKAR
jgi:hypothetical protein